MDTWHKGSVRARGEGAFQVEGYEGKGRLGCQDRSGHVADRRRLHRPRLEVPDCLEVSPLIRKKSLSISGKWADIKHTERTTGVPPAPGLF